MKNTFALKKQCVATGLGDDKRRGQNAQTEGGVESALAVGAGWLSKDKLFARAWEAGPKFVARTDEVPVGGYKLFRYPTENDPCILVRLSENEFAAYSQACTHLMCPVNYQHEKQQFYCPCHEGFFSAKDGHVLAGPPPRPLPRLKLELNGGEIRALGFLPESA